MKNFFKIVAVLLIVIILGGFGYTTWLFNTYKPEAIQTAVEEKNLAYFQESYEGCKKAFIAAAQGLENRYKGVVISALKVPGARDDDLTIDYCYIPAQKEPKKLFILASAVHGVEGYVGSAVQQMFLKELVKETDMNTIGLLLIHAVNPYGFKNNRRFSENNVDLNRNCSTDKALYDTVNDGYGPLDRFLNPKKPVNLTGMDNFFFHINAVHKIVKYSMANLRQAVLQGQYQYPKGVYFGGNALEQPIVTVTQLIREVSRPYPTVFAVDLHSGYGTNGVLHLLPDPIEDVKKKQEIQSLFEGQLIEWADTEGFYTITGSFATYLGEALPDKNYLTMTFEFGTLDTLTTMGSIKALHNVIVENQGAMFGYASNADEKGVKSRYLEGYYPSSRAWRSKAVHDARPILLNAVQKYSAMP